ncbi:MAG: xanthine dehydrogenase family protein molybdopterin-binding subunit [Betaproteobacteria bacterium]|nr:MAG: xanthine dehydrogenase family protein molybdopterin-binding subunit [Betaproteobacteria bacterium]
MNTVAETRLTRPGSLEKNPRLSQWLRVHRDGTVSIYSGKVEIGQGILTALAQIAAEELGIAVERIRMVPADTAVSPDEGVTSGSLSIQDSGAALRRACAQARAVLLASAAARLAVSTRDVQVADGVVRAGGRSTSFWECADEALFDREIDDTAALRSPGDYRVVGKPTPRRDLPDKIAGQPRFIQDMALPGMLYGRIVRPPHNFAGLISLDDSKVKSMPGLAAIVRDGAFVGVLAEREDVAISVQRALRLAASWREADPPPRDVHAWLKEHAAEHRVISEKGNAGARSRATKTLEASFTKPYLSHASIGPSCAIARIDDGKLMVWSHSQGIFNLRRDLALALGMREDAVVVRHVEGAGCYGHNGADDAALDAALLARAAGGRPVQVQWMRDDEFAWAPCGPAMALNLRAALDAHGDIVDWEHELWSNGHSSRPGRGDSPALLAAWHLTSPHERPSAINMPLPAGAADRNAIPIYDFPNQRVVNHYVRAMPVRTSALRSLGAYANVFAIESFMDELAQAAGIDPIAFRLRHLKDPRGRAVMEAAARRAEWSRWKSTEGRGHGIGFARYKNMGAYCAAVAEVEVGRDVRVDRLILAVDVGLVINPDGVINQIEGGAIQSTSWTLKEQVKLGARGIASLGWEDYPILKFSEAPPVEVELASHPELPAVGAGEAAQGPTAAAIANAVAHALGLRVRDLPLTHERIAAAISQST